MTPQETAVHATLQERGLCLPCAPPLLSPLGGGSGPVFAIAGIHGPELVAKVRPLACQALAAEWENLNFLHGHGGNGGAPRPVHRGASGGWSVLLIERHPGTTLHEMLPHAADAPAALNLADQAGRALGRLHSVSDKDAPKGTGDIKGDCRQHLSKPAGQNLALAMKVRAAALLVLETHYTPCFCHGDFNLKQVVAADHSPMGLVDFECAGLNDPLIDLCKGVLHFPTNPAGVSAAATAFVSGYNNSSPQQVTNDVALAGALVLAAVHAPHLVDSVVGLVP